MSRATWGSRIGFIFAVAGSAVGLANIWRFPYIVGEHGGSAFVILYLVCLLLIGFPVFIAEILIGRTTQTSPGGAFQKLGGKPVWGFFGRMTIVTGFIVSAFYSAVAAWVLGYFVEALRGNLTVFAHSAETTGHFASLIENPFWSVGYHFAFLFCATTVLFLGVREGIERGNKIMMPLLFALLIILVVKGLMMPNAAKAMKFLFKPDWSALTPTAFLIALGQSFFTLSLGQGTMVTYGSYVGDKENLLKSCVPVALMDTCVSLLSAIAVFTIVFSVNMEPDSGPGLIFHTLPLVFSQLPGGYLLALLFFFLVFLAALTSEISALEPTIAWLMDEKGWKRHNAVIATCSASFLVGVPCALSASSLSSITLFGQSILDFTSTLVSSFMIPIGGFLAVILVGWIWGFRNAITQLKMGSFGFFERYPFMKSYFRFCFKFCAPVLIIIVFIHTLLTSF